MSNQNIFSLNQVYRSQIAGNWSVKSDVWDDPQGDGTKQNKASGVLDNTTYGYFAGNMSVSYIERVDISTDLIDINTRANFPDTLWQQGSLASPTDGISYGGRIFPVNDSRSEIYKMDLSNDTVRNSAPNGVSRSATTATGNTSYGYWSCGLQYPPSTPTAHSNYSRYNYSNDTVDTTHTNSLIAKLRSNGGTGTQSYGYVGGGYNPSSGDTSNIERLDYSNDTTVSNVALLTANRSGGTAEGDTNYGYWFFGSTSSTVHKFDYSNDTTNATPANGLYNGATGTFPNPGYYIGSFGNRSGSYFPLKREESVSHEPNQITKYNYSNDTSTICLGKSYSTASRSTSSKFSGGFCAAAFATPLQSPSVTLNHTRANFYKGQYGYFGTGDVGTATYSSYLFKYDYTTDTITSINPAGAGRRSMGSVSSLDYGYFAGGYNPGIPINTNKGNYRTDFSNDTSDTNSKGQLNTFLYSVTGVGNKDNGYFLGGGDSNINSKSFINKLDFSNDTTQMSWIADLPTARRGMKATGNQNYGWASENTVTSTIVRLAYSNDSVSIPGAYLVAGSPSGKNSGSAAVGNKDYGWWMGGGTTPAPEDANQPKASYIQRLDYSNDTTNLSNRAYLLQQWGQSSATTHWSNPNYGYCTGGRITSGTSPYYSETFKTYVYKLDFSNDTVNVGTHSYSQYAFTGDTGTSAANNANLS